MSSTQTTEADVGAKGADSPQSNKVSSKPAGTGFFLPLAMRSSDSSTHNERVNSRGKPSRRRNVSTPNIGLGSGAVDRNACSLRSNSSSNLRNGRRNTPDGQARRFSFSIEEECTANYSHVLDVQTGPGVGSQLAAFPASAYNKHAAAVAAALAATSAGQASRVASMPQQLNLAAFTQLPPGLEQPMQQQDVAQHMLRQHTAPVQLPVLNSSQSTSPRVSSSSGGGMQDARSSCMATLSASVTSSTPISIDALQTFYGPSALRPTPGGADVLPSVESSSDLGSLLLVMNSSSNPLLSELPGAAAAAPPPPTPGSSNSSGPGHITVPTPAAAAAAAGGGGAPIISQVSLSTWAVPQVSPTATAAGTELSSFDAGSSDIEEMIQKRIDQLLLQKQLLQLRQQHKQQQALLQLQQQQQEQALQQQLQSLQRVGHKLPQKQSSERMLQQQQQQQQQVQPSSNSFTGMQSLQQLQVQPSSNSFTGMQPMQQQQQGMLQVQQSDSSITQMSPEQLQREQLQLQQQLQQQQPSVSVGNSNLLQGALSSPQQLLPAAGLMVSTVSGPACTGLQVKLQPAANGTLPASSSALSAFAGTAGLGALQDDVVPVMSAGTGSSFSAEFDPRLNGGAGASAGLASWGSGQQLNLAGGGGGVGPGYGGLFGCPSGPAAVTTNDFSSSEGAWSFDAGISFNQ